MKRKEALKYFQEKYGANMEKSKDRRKYGLRPSEAAKKIENTFYKEGMAKYYKTFYRDASMLGHAGNVLAFITPTEKNKFILEIKPKDKNIDVYLKVALRLFFHILLGLNELFGLGISDDIIMNLSKKIKTHDNA